MDQECYQEFVKQLPCAAYLIQGKGEMPVVCANHAFYEQLGCNEEEFQYRCGGRLAAAMDVRPYLAGMDTSMSEAFEHHVPAEDGTVRTWRTFLRSFDVLFLCLSVDVTDYTVRLAAADRLEASIRTMAARLNIELFEWDQSSGRVEVYVALRALRGIPRFSSYEVFRAHLEYTFAGGESIRRLWDAMDRLENGDGGAACELEHTHRSGGPIWSRLSLQRDGSKVYGSLEDITKERKLTLNYLTETQFYHTMLAEKTAYGHLDVTEDRILMVGGLWNLYNELLDTMSYSNLIEEFINKVVHPVDRAHYLELMRRENLFQAYRSGVKRLGCEFRRIVEQNKMEWMELGVCLFEEPMEGHLMALMYIQNINARKKTALDNDMEKLRDDFDSFMGAQGDIAYLVDPESLKLLVGNESFYERLGLTKKQCEGRTCYDLMHGRKSPCPFCARANWSTDKFFLWKDFNNCLEQEFLMKHKLVRWQNRDVLLVVAVDISNDKSVVDSLENDTSESRSLLSAVQLMKEAETLPQAMVSVLESIGYFLGADAVDLWESGQDGDFYRCACRWAKSGRPVAVDEHICRTVSLWLSGQSWSGPVMIESPEMVLGECYDFYHFMRDSDIRNQRWVKLCFGGEDYGYISVSNSAANLQNVSFLEAISGFVVSEIKNRRMYQSLLYAHQYDVLTGVLNRNSYEEAVKRFDGETVTSLGVVTADIVGLSEINRTQGSEAGDLCLRALADGLRRLFGGEYLYRLGGDEFLVIVPDISRKELEEKLLQAPELIEYRVTLGYSWDNVEKHLPELIEQAVADRGYHKGILSGGKILRAADRLQLLQSLMTDIRDGCYEIFLQPQVHLHSGALVGAEALIRYRDRSERLVSPAEFIPQMEVNGLIRYVDLFVLEQICQMLAAWRESGVAAPRISVNFSRPTLMEDNILSSTEQIMDRYGLPLSCVEIEITENAIAETKGRLSQVIDSFRQAGFYLALDDFGVKYSNISMLSDSSFHLLKLDKSLIWDLSEAANRAILKHMVALCQDLELNVIAEGVETQKQRESLIECGCPWGQGYLFGRPMPVLEFEQLWLTKTCPCVGSASSTAN